jgi:hypothetical protein
MMSNLKTEYKYIYFEERPNPGKKTKRFTCYNLKSAGELGTIRWESRWRQYVFEVPVADPCDSAWWVYFSRGCLRDIADFIDQLMEERKK